MKLYLKFTILLAAILLQSCSTNKVFWVNSYKSNCTSGAGNTQCLLINENSNIENPEWKNFYSNIEGFNFKPGYFQKIKVKVTTLKKENVPADASSLTYKLIDVQEELKDNRFQLNDIWVVTAINGKTIAQTSNLPQLEINISKMQILGNDACNNFNGEIKQLTSTDILIGNLASTRKICGDMTITNAFNTALQNTSKYSLKGLNLFFYNNEGNETLVLKKVD
jgi:heat shock protein HslJ